MFHQGFNVSFMAIISAFFIDFDSLIGKNLNETNRQTKKSTNFCLSAIIVLPITNEHNELQPK